jgi:phosphodiesterase/alkaline phosphatase D-like protein
VHAELSGLIQEATYHYRLAAANSIDTQFGADRTFTPHAVLNANTENATAVTASTSTLNGSFNSDGLETQFYFEWAKGKPNGKFDHTTPLTNGGAATSSRSVSAELEGLEDYTVYHFRLAAVNSLGTSYGEELVFRTTPPSVPTITTVDSSAVTNSAVTIGAVITPHFGETIYSVEYGESTSYGSLKLGESQLPADDHQHAVELVLSGLLPGRTYHYRAVAVNYGGVTRGADLTFTTQDTPRIISTGSSAVGRTTAQLVALVSPSLSMSTVHFEYGMTPAYGAVTAPVLIGGGSEAQSVMREIAGLMPQTTYHFRAVAVNGIGTAESRDQTFTTGADNTVPPPPRSKKCRRGFVKRHGKCVKRHRARHGAHRRGRHGRKHGVHKKARRTQWSD